MRRLADLGPGLLEQLRTLRYDTSIEKHEGPDTWASYLSYPEPDRADIWHVRGYNVLLPLPASSHDRLRLVRLTPSVDGTSLTLLLHDNTFYPDYYLSEFYTGRLAVCDRLGDSSLYVAIAYHAMFCDDTVLWRTPGAGA